MADTYQINSGSNAPHKTLKNIDTGSDAVVATDEVIQERAGICHGTHFELTADPQSTTQGRGREQRQHTSVAREQKRAMP